MINKAFGYNLNYVPFTNTITKKYLCKLINNIFKDVKSNIYDRKMV